MIGKRATWLAAGAVAAGLASAGIAADRRLGTRPLGAAAGLAAAGAYLTGTFAAGRWGFGGAAATNAPDGAFALTFDDGPDPRHTAAISRLLRERGHAATFFVLARAVDAHPATAAAVLADGHELASHGADHSLLAFASPRELRRQLAAAEHAVQRATGSPPQRLFRAPHGVRSPWLTRVLERSGYTVCGWDGAIFDTAEPGPDAIARRAVRLLRPGAVLLLHDGDGSGRGGSRLETLEALPAILAAAERKGLRSVQLSSLVAPAAARAGAG